MTGRQWLASNDPDAMLAFLEQHLPNEETDGDPFHLPAIRKVRLFAVACCRRVEHLLSDRRSRAALDVMERYLDRRATRPQLDRATEAAADAASRLGAVAGAEYSAANAVYVTLDDIQDDFTDVEEVATATCDAVSLAHTRVSRGVRAARRARKAEVAHQAHLLRDIFGNPFRPVVFDPAWLTSDVLALARGVYGEKAFDRMPILADALQDAGCDSADVLTHCRADAAHVRGCWVIDLLLGKG